MNTRNAPLSPVSVGGSEWSGISKYQNGGDPYDRSTRGLVSPPDSGGGYGKMNGFPGPRSVGGPSPPPSIARSSNASALYARSESGKSMRDENNEAILSIHYVALKKYLQSTSKDGRANPPPNRARDKLLRLSAVQFLELSTDVYDELLRRQSLQRRVPGPPPPEFLQPEDTFHPKRNQARQKLSTLGSSRFRDLVTDVFCELERRFPAFSGTDIPRMDSPVSVRGGPSRSQTPVNGMNGLPPRGPSRMRRPSDASSIRSGPPRMNGDYPVPPSPGIPPNGSFDRPQQKQFQSNTIVPNKSTMVEEDDDGAGDDEDAFGLERAATGGESKGAMSEADKRLLEESQTQVRDLQSKLDKMEDDLKRKDDELNRLLDGERNRASAENMEKKQWDDQRAALESQLGEARNLNESMRDELDRMRDGHAAEVRSLQGEVENARQNGSRNMGSSDMMRENEDLRIALQEQQAVTEQVRREAQQFLQEMKVLSQQHNPAWEKQAELEKTVESLEQEVKEWRNRYARTKTQLRNMRASSIGLTIDQDAAKYIREKGFTQDNGLVKDVHVTKFQIAIDELLRRARTDDPEKVIDSMKAVVVSVRRITKDIDDSVPNDAERAEQQRKMKSRVSATANNLITASKNFAASAGISPVSLLDAAASHLVAALVELLRNVKIRATPAGELEDDDDGTMTPVGSTGFFSNRTTQQEGFAAIPPLSQDKPSPLEPPPRFQGLGGGQRESTNSSTYSPVSSPRQSADAYGNGGMNGYGGMNYMNVNKDLPNAPNGYGMPPQRDNRIEDLKIYLEDQTAILVSTIQGLVGSIRGDAPIAQISSEINSIAEVVDRVVGETEASGKGNELVDRLASSRLRLLEASQHGQDLSSRGLSSSDREWRMWTQTLPPIAFEIARETKELVQQIDRLVNGGGADDFS